MTTLVSLFLLAGLTQGEEAPATIDCATQLESERTAHIATRAECEGLKARIAELELELARAEEERLLRETEWLTYTKAISGLSDTVIPASVVFESVLAEEAKQEEEEQTLEQIARELRSHEIFIALRSLFIAEGIDGYDFLEAGLVSETHTGPVVLRMLDEMRRPIGSLTAARLRLEASETGHVLTLVFEEGYERRGGLKVPFQGGTLADLSGAIRRIVLPSVDPRPWKEALPELFAKEGVSERKNDGLWDLGKVRARLNELLREDAAAGHYRIRTLSGINAGLFREVHLEERDSEGHVVRRFFADRMQLEQLEKGIRILLEGGAQIRGNEKQPFRDGHFRIFLPAVRIDAWCDGQLPGLGEASVKAPTKPKEEVRAEAK